MVFLKFDFEKVNCEKSQQRTTADDNKMTLSSADNICKQFRLRSGPTECRSWSGSKLFADDGVPEIFFEKVNFEKSQQTTTKA